MTSFLRRENGLGDLACRMTTALRMPWRIKIAQSPCFAWIILLFQRTKVYVVDLKVPIVSPLATSYPTSSVPGFPCLIPLNFPYHCTFLSLISTRRNFSRGQNFFLCFFKLIPLESSKDKEKISSARKIPPSGNQVLRTCCCLLLLFVVVTSVPTPVAISAACISDSFFCSLSFHSLSHSSSSYSSPSSIRPSTARLFMVNF